MDPVYASRSLSRSNACAQFKETIEKCFDGVSKYFKGFPDAAEGRVNVINFWDKFIEFRYVYAAFVESRTLYFKF